MSPAEIQQYPESFNFNLLEHVTIDEIKNLLQISNIELRTIKDFEGNITSYLCHWDFHRKLTIKIERELVSLIKNDRTISLDLSRCSSNGKYGPYNLFTITAYEPSEEISESGEWETSDQYSEFNGYNGWSDDDIYDAFEGDPENTWNVD
ncbi:hypothetical protein ACE38W_01005 [Chitinophaga sp. Hz27]|uniref:hypothetical protein n=1 Tax=Chitinophaga sp. Hz27 TaxID=3347169 RepID=UPI0035D5DD32